jgi:TRAP-type C4-dicarboxylate transport system permease large subunit
MILYSLVSSTSVADLFISGVLPGILMAGGFVVICWWIAKRRGFKPSGAISDNRTMLRLAFKSSPALAMPILILVGMRFGFATPTEIAVLACIYAIALSVFFYKDLTCSAICGWLLTFDEVPTRFAAWVTSTLHSPWLVLLAMNVLLIVVGGPLDLPPGILLLGPIFVPLAAQIGLDPVQLGLIMVINLGIGVYTPPIGTTLFISATIAKSSLDETTVALWPFFSWAIIVLLLITYIPWLTLY